MRLDPLQSDGELALRAKAGDEQAFTALVRRHKEPIYRLIRRYVGDAEDAYDLLQESFASAWLALKTFDASRPFDVWMRRVALNKCRDWSRRLAVRRLIRRTLTLDTSEALASTDLTPNPETIAIDREVLRQLERSIAALPARLKEPLILVTMDDMSHDAAAKLLGVSTKTIETRIYRARQRLAKALGLNDT